MVIQWLSMELPSGFIKFGWEIPGKVVLLFQLAMFDYRKAIRMMHHQIFKILLGKARVTEA